MVVAAFLKKEMWVEKNGAPERIRTSDLWFRRPTLYPAELQARVGANSFPECSGLALPRQASPARRAYPPTSSPNPLALDGLD